MHKVYLGIGGNIGNKSNNFITARDFIAKELGKIINSSSVYESPPWGFHAEENFWNQVLLIETLLTPEKLLTKIQEIENKFDRKRKPDSYSSRKIDIDILYYDTLFIETDSLIIPHPKIHQRMFVLVPLVEIAPNFKHPLFRLTNLQLLENCKDKSVIKKVE